jgi:hypothetical protein
LQGKNFQVPLDFFKSEKFYYTFLELDENMALATEVGVVLNELLSHKLIHLEEASKRKIQIKEFIDYMQTNKFALRNELPHNIRSLSSLR